ncbi:TPA: hypothetical protein ACGO8I_001827 [Streptococcus suis]
MKDKNNLPSILGKLAKFSFVVIGMIMNYIAKETGRVWKENASPSNPPRIWWW